MNDAAVAYEIGLLEDLADPEEAAAYLNAALEDGDQEVFLLALRHVSDLDRTRFRIGLKPVSDDDEIERLKLAQSKVLKAILDDAEARIQATGGIRNEDFWNQLDAEYQNIDDSD